MIGIFSEPRARPPRAGVTCDADAANLPPTHQLLTMLRRTSPASLVFLWPRVHHGGCISCSRASRIFALGRRVPSPPALLSTLAPATTTSTSSTTASASAATASAAHTTAKPLSSARKAVSRLGALPDLHLSSPTHVESTVAAADANETVPPLAKNTFDTVSTAVCLEARLSHLDGRDALLRQFFRHALVDGVKSAWEAVRRQYELLLRSPAPRPRRRANVTKELIAYLLCDGCIDAAHEVFALYRSSLSVAASLRSHELPSEIVRSVSVPAGVVAVASDHQHGAVADAWLFTGRALSGTNLKADSADLVDHHPGTRSEDDMDAGVDSEADIGVTVDRDLVESQLLASVFSVILFAPAFVRARHYHGIMLKSSRYAFAVGMLEKYSIVFADPLPLPLSALVKSCDLFADLLPVGAKCGTDKSNASEFVYKAFNQLRDVVFKTGRIDLLRAFVLIKIKRGFNIRTIEYSQCVILMARNMMIEEAMQLFLSVVAFESFDANCTLEGKAVVVMHVNSFMLKALVDAMVCSGQLDAATQLLKKGAELGMPSSDTLLGSRMRLALLRNEHDDVEIMYLKYRTGWCDAHRQDSINVFRNNGDPMVYASTLESRAVTQRWEDLHQVLVEMELDGMSLPAIPTDWLLRVVDRLLDANQVEIGLHLVALMNEHAMLNPESCVEYHYPRTAPSQSALESQYQPHSPTSIFFSAPSFSRALHEECRRLPFSTSFANSVLGKLVVRLASTCRVVSDKSHALSQASLITFFVSIRGGFVLDVSAYESAVSAACSLCYFEIADLILEVCKGKQNTFARLAGLDISAANMYRISSQLIAEVASCSLSSMPVDSRLNVVSSKRWSHVSAPAVTASMYFSLILAHGNAAQQALASNNVPDANRCQELVVVYFTSMLTRVANFPHSAHVGLCLLQNLQNRPRLMVEAYARLVQGAECDTELEVSAIKLVIGPLLEELHKPGGSLYRQVLISVLARSLQLRVDAFGTDLKLLSNAARSFFISESEDDVGLGIVKLDRARFLRHNNDTLDDEIVLDAEDGAIPASIVNCSNVDAVCNDVITDLSIAARAGAPMSLDHGYELRYFVSRILSIAPQPAAFLSSDALPRFLRACCELARSSRCEDLKELIGLVQSIGLRYLSRTVGDMPSSTDSPFARPELWARIVLSCAHNNHIELVRRIWLTDLARCGVNRAHPLILASFVGCVARFGMPSVALSCLRSLQYVVFASEPDDVMRSRSHDDLVLRLVDALQNAGALTRGATLTKDCDSCVIDLSATLRAVCRTPVQKRVRVLVLETAIHSWAAMGRFDLVSEALANWLLSANSSPQAPGAGGAQALSDGPTAAAYDFAMNACSRWSTCAALATPPTAAHLSTILPKLSEHSFPELTAPLIHSAHLAVRGLDAQSYIDAPAACSALVQACFARLIANSLSSRGANSPAHVRESHAIALFSTLNGSRDSWLAHDALEVMLLLGLPVSTRTLFALLRVNIASHAQSDKSDADKAIAKSVVDEMLVVDEPLSDEHLLALLELAVAIDRFDLALQLLVTDQRVAPRRSFYRVPSSSGFVDLRPLPALLRRFLSSDEPPLMHRALNLHVLVEIVLKAIFRGWLIRASPSEVTTTSVTAEVGHQRPLTLCAGDDEELMIVVRNVLRAMTLSSATALEAGCVVVQTADVAHCKSMVCFDRDVALPEDVHPKFSAARAPRIDTANHVTTCLSKPQNHVAVL